MTNSSNKKFSIKTEYLDTKRKNLDDAYAIPFTKYLKVKYSNYSPKAIYLTDDNALVYGLKHLHTLFPDVPIFFSGVNDYSQVHRIDKSNVTGVFEKKEITPNLKLLSRISGNRQIVVIGDGSSTYQSIKIEVQKEIALDEDIQVTFISNSHIKNIQEELLKFKNIPIILSTLGGIHNQLDEVIPLEEVIEHITRSSSNIILSMEDVYILPGVLGGYVTSGIEQGKSAAQLVLRYLSGEKITEIKPLIQSPNKYMFNDEVIKNSQIHLPASIIEQAKIINPRAKWVSRYKNYIIGLFILLSFLLVGPFIVYIWVLRLKNNKLIEQEQSVTYNEERLRDFAEIASDWFWEMDENLRYTKFSGHFSESLNIDQNIYIGKTRREVSIGHENDDYWQEHLDLLDNHQSFNNFNYFINAGDQEPLYITINGRAIFDKKGGFKGYRGTGKDLTAQKNIEIELMLARDEAEKANQAKSEFLALMSHDLRTPLNAIMGFSDLMRLNTFGSINNPHYEQYVNDIHNSGALLISLINDILDLSKIEAGKYDLIEKELNVPTLINTSVRQLENMAASANVNLSISVPEGFPNIQGDERALIQILNNLVSNAIKFTLKNGDVNISAFIDENNGITLQVIDTGIGMSETEITMAMQPFEQIKSTHSKKHDGTGLGLYLCSKFMDLFNGTLEVSSVVDQGTTITMRFPPERTYS